MYTPYLRNKQSEILALQLLDDDIRKEIIPFIEITAAPSNYTAEKKEKYLLNRFKQLEKLHGFEYIIIDSSYLSSEVRIDGKHPLLAAYEKLKTNSLPIPATSIHRDSFYNDTCVQLLNRSDSNILCIRLDRDDLILLQRNSAKLRNLISELNPKKVLFFLEFGFIQENEINLCRRIYESCMDILYSQEPSFVIINSYSIPEKIHSSIRPNEFAYIERFEEKLFNELVNDTNGRCWFSDYTIVNPSVEEIDFSIISKTMCPKIIYTIDDYFFIIRGNRMLTHGNSQYFTLAKEVTKLPDFMGEFFSAGDNIISECSKMNGKSGNPGSWLKVGINHHLTYVSKKYSKFKPIF